MLSTAPEELCNRLLQSRTRLLLRVLWPLTWPVRRYWVGSRRKLGKRLLVDGILKRLLPAPPSGFEAELPGGGRIFLHYREDVGLVTFLSGGFERAELEEARRHARPGSTAIDVGANVGVYTVTLARAVGPAGGVLAFEPFPETVRRLEENVRLNGLANVAVHSKAVAAEPGEVELRLGSDPGFHSTATVAERRGSGASLRVLATTLDEEWEAAGRPPLSFVKIDTEGAEEAVVLGARDLLREQRPVVLAEVRDERVLALLRGLRYDDVRPRGFAPGNVLFVPRHP
jgi:FkbM family methyltransferase